MSLQRLRWLPPLHVVNVPDDAPDDLRRLARLVATEGPRLLAERSPDLAGILLIHPDAEVYPEPAKGAPRGVFARVLDLATLETFAREHGLAARRRPGWYGCLLIGAERCGFSYLTPLENAA